jgi:hypothetical protein
MEQVCNREASMTIRFAENETSRRVADGGRQRAGSLGVTQYYADTLIPFPSRSILTADDPLKPLDLATARLNKAVVFALAVNFLSWGLILLAGRAIASVFL